MDTCSHFQKIEEEIGGILQIICAECGEIIDSELGLVDDKSIHDTNINKIVDDCYVPQVGDPRFHLGNDDASIYKRKIIKYKKIALDVANKLKIDINNFFLDSVARVYVDFINTAKKHHCRTALIVECIIFNAGPAIQLPSINEICKRVGICVRDVTRAKRYFKNYCLQRKIDVVPNFLKNYEKVANNKSFLSTKVTNFCHDRKLELSVLQTSQKFLDLLEKCNILPFCQHDAAAEAVVHFVCSLEQQNIQGIKLDFVRFSIIKLRMKKLVPFEE